MEAARGEQFHPDHYALHQKKGLFLQLVLASHGLQLTVTLWSTGSAEKSSQSTAGKALKRFRSEQSARKGPDLWEPNTKQPSPGRVHSSSTRHCIEIFNSQTLC